MLAGLGHGAVGGRDDEDRAVHLGGAGDHVLHVVGVPGAVDVGVVAGVGLVLDVGDRDRDAALALLRGLVDLVERGEVGQTLVGLALGDRGRERGLAVVDVPDRADVHVGLRALELLLSAICRSSLVYSPVTRAMISFAICTGTSLYACSCIGLCAARPWVFDRRSVA